MEGMAGFADRVRALGLEQAGVFRERQRLLREMPLRPLLGRAKSATGAVVGKKTRDMSSDRRTATTEPIDFRAMAAGGGDIMIVPDVDDEMVDAGPAEAGPRTGGRTARFGRGGKRIGAVGALGLGRNGRNARPVSTPVLITAPAPGASVPPTAVAAREDHDMADRRQTARGGRGRGKKIGRLAGPRAGSKSVAAPSPAFVPIDFAPVLAPALAVEAWRRRVAGATMPATAPGMLQRLRREFDSIPRGLALERERERRRRARIEREKGAPREVATRRPRPPGEPLGVYRTRRRREAASARRRRAIEGWRDRTAGTSFPAVDPRLSDGLRERFGYDTQVRGPRVLALERARKQRVAERQARERAGREQGTFRKLGWARRASIEAAERRRVAHEQAVARENEAAVQQDRLRQKAEFEESWRRVSRLRSERNEARSPHRQAGLADMRIQGYGWGRLAGPPAGPMGRGRFKRRLAPTGPDPGNGLDTPVEHLPGIRVGSTRRVVSAGTGRRSAASRPATLSAGATALLPYRAPRTRGNLPRRGIAITREGVFLEHPEVPGQARRRRIRDRSNRPLPAMRLFTEDRRFEKPRRSWKPTARDVDPALIMHTQRPRLPTGGYRPLNQPGFGSGMVNPSGRGHYFVQGNRADELARKRRAFYHMSLRRNERVLREILARARAGVLPLAESTLRKRPSFGTAPPSFVSAGPPPYSTVAPPPTFLSGMRPAPVRPRLTVKRRSGLPPSRASRSLLRPSGGRVAVPSAFSQSKRQRSELARQLRARAPNRARK